MQNFWLVTAHMKFHQICTFIGSFCWKYIKLQLKKCRGLMSHDTEKVIQISNTCCFKNDNLVNFDLSCQNSQNFHFDWFLLREVYNVWPKKVQRSYLSWHWRLMQNFKKNWLTVWKITWGIWQFFMRALETLKFGILMESFYPQ